MREPHTKEGTHHLKVSSALMMLFIRLGDKIRRRNRKTFYFRIHYIICWVNHNISAHDDLLNTSDIVSHVEFMFL